MLTDDARRHLAMLNESLAKVPDWTAQSVEEAVRETAKELNVKLGDLAQPLRAALTGSTVSPGIFDVLYVLGRSETLARISDQTQSP